MKKFKLSPYILMICSFLIVISIGTILLILPFSTYEGISLSFIDAFFTSVSAVCVTGLSTVVVSSTFTVFGKIVIALLIQIGGLSFVTIAVFILMAIGVRFGIKDRLLLKESLNQSTLGGVVRLVKYIMIITFTIELFFVFINCFILTKYYPFSEALGYSFFHTISSFNNAGFDIFGPTSLIQYSSDIALNISTMLLIIIGGLGFVVIYDILRAKHFKNFTLHTKIVLTSTAFLIVVPFVLFLLIDKFTVIESLFLSITTRTAGFSSVDLTTISLGSLSLIIVLMFIGASPGSTGGGIKTTTFFIMLKSIFDFGKKKGITCFKRRLSTSSVIRAFVLTVLALMFICIMIFIICIIEKDLTLNEIVFEVVSAFGTVGLSLGITMELSVLSKILICVTMFVGRLGPLTIMSAWTTRMKNLNSPETNIIYVEETIAIG